MTGYDCPMEKDKTSPFTLRLSCDLRKELEEIAKKNDRNLSNQIVVALKQFVRDTKSGL